MRTIGQKQTVVFARNLPFRLLFRSDNCTSEQGATLPHGESVVEQLQEASDFSDEYLAASREAIDEPGSKNALLATPRQIAEAQGWLSPDHSRATQRR